MTLMLHERLPLLVLDDVQGANQVRFRLHSPKSLFHRVFRMDDGPVVVRLAFACAEVATQARRRRGRRGGRAAAAAAGEFGPS
jgi:hypothetical protein